MKLLSWNARGLGNPRGIRTLCDLVQREALDVLFLQETRLKAHEFEVCKFKLGFVNCLVVDCVGRKGGPAMLWGRELSLSISSYSQCHIDAYVEDFSVHGVWYRAGVYGFPEVGQRHRTWDMLRLLSRHRGEAWIVFGDFNEILHPHEKCGGRPRMEWQISAFRQALTDCCLRDLGFKGNRFTWSNRQGGSRCTNERLDRAVVNQSWLNFFPNAMVIHGVVAYSNHVPIWVSSAGEGVPSRVKRQFRFEEMWVGEKACEDIIKSTWLRGESSNSMDVVISHIKECGTRLDVWNKSCFGNVQQQLTRARKHSELLSNSDPLGEFIPEHNQAREEFHKWLERDELMWRQRSKSLFASSNPSSSTSFLEGLQGRVTSDMNAELSQHYTAAEIAAVLQALNSGSFPSSLNHTYLTLIPKTKCPAVVADYQPISLCNVVYKLIFKVIANRLKKVLPFIIGDSQSAFALGRLITDNVLIAYELIHFLKHKKRGNQGYMSLKLDMSKAYDRVEWCFLRKVMEMLGFESGFISLVMYCVQTVSFSVLVNGEPKGPIFPSRGLRQGDPLSLYLFLFCTEGLSCLLNQAGLRQDIYGLRICRNAPTINHLLLANDSVIFCKASVAENRRVQDVLAIYESCSGQKINKEKTSMVFSCKVGLDLQEEIHHLWGNDEIQQYEKYLGLPPIVGRSKTRAFQSIKQRV
ncbi:uncharacterized protein LOC122312617 [Carya illinoinensis]|uniref:uncharacterized protein LOC122312617 n=1 Tax=Carya illinoinensis TaxID=32201 RepID=UPI001C7257BD|nr:uncharacterized protein LOC122312617 [Carya illinoinensis]